MKFKLTAVFVLTIAMLLWLMVADEKAVMAPDEAQTIVGTIVSQQITPIKEHEITKTSSLDQPTQQQINQSFSKGSLQGSSPDGAVNITEYGDVQLDKDLHRLFDYYLSMTGEQPIEDIRSLMLNTASDILSFEQLAQLRNHFDRYIDYLKSAEDHADNNLEMLDLTDGLSQLEAISQLRRELLGDDMADAFFAEEESYAKHMMQMQLIGESDAPEEQQIKWLNNEDQATAYQDVLIENQQFNDSQVNASERMEIRTAAYGEAVAQQLAQLDDSQQQWQTTVNHYIETRSRLQNNSPALNQFEQNYTPTELKRLQAYYRAHLQGGKSP